MENKKSSTGLIIGILVVIAILLALIWCYKMRHQSKVYFGNLKDGAQVESPFKVEMKAENLVVEPASNGVVKGHGHFHIIIDSPLPPTGEPVPMDSLHLHYGKGQTEATLDLPEGEHTLILQFADGSHLPYDPQVVQTIHIVVTKRNVPTPPVIESTTSHTMDSTSRQVVQTPGGPMTVNTTKSVKTKSPDTTVKAPGMPAVSPTMGAPAAGR